MSVAQLELLSQLKIEYDLDESHAEFAPGNHKGYQLIARFEESGNTVIIQIGDERAMHELHTLNVSLFSGSRYHSAPKFGPVKSISNLFECLRRGDLKGALRILHKRTEDGKKRPSWSRDAIAAEGEWRSTFQSEGVGSPPNNALFRSCFTGNLYNDQEALDEIIKFAEDGYDQGEVRDLSESLRRVVEKTRSQLKGE